MTPALDFVFPRSWQADLLVRRPPILPARHFTYPGEVEEADRGALEVLVRPATGAPFLATFALGFADPAAPSGLWSCPAPDTLCALSGGYAYLLDTLHPERCTHLAMRPVLEVRPLPAHGLLLFAGHINLMAWGPAGLAWESPRLSSEGLRITHIAAHALHGFGWNLITDRETPFALDLRTGGLLPADDAEGHSE